MKNLRVLPILLAIILLSSGYYIKAQTVNDVSDSYSTSIKQDLNFDFENRQPENFKWQTAFKYGGIVIDTSEFINGKFSFRIQSNPSLFMGRDFAVSLSQYMQLPFDATRVDVSIYTKSDNLEAAWLKLYLLDHHENLVLKDSVRINDNKNIWELKNMRVTPNHAQKLFVEIEVNNMNSYPFGPGKIWLDKMELKINNQNIESFGNPELQFSPIDIGKIQENISLDPNNLDDFKNIPGLKKHRIIALGETIHGSHEFGKTSYNMARHMIENENCKLVLFEIPYNLGLLVNDFVAGNADIDLDESFRYFYYDLEELRDFLNWLKEYNEDRQRKVIVLGTDIGNTSINENFLAFMNNNIRGTEADSIMSLFRNQKNMKAIQLYQDTPYERLGISKFNRKLISEFLRYSDIPGYFIYNNLDNKRDYVQFKHAQFAIDSLLEKDEKALIYAHMGHLNKKNSIGKYYTPAAGSFLANYYGSDYFVIGLLSASGTYTYYKSGELVTTNLAKAESGSLEDLCLKAGKKVFYKEVADEIQCYSYRMSGYKPFTREFSPYNCLGRMDAFIFFEKTTSAKVPDNPMTDLIHSFPDSKK